MANIRSKGQQNKSSSQDKSRQAASATPELNPNALVTQLQLQLLTEQIAELPGRSMELVLPIQKCQIQPQ